MPNIDPFDAVQDARSEARYSEDPQAEPDLAEVKETLARMSGPESGWLTDESTGFRG